MLIVTTSNISGTVDLAFVDRADIKHYIGYPSRAAIYQIYHSCITELKRVGSEQDCGKGWILDCIQDIYRILVFHLMLNLYCIIIISPWVKETIVLTCHVKTAMTTITYTTFMLFSPLTCN